MTVAIERGDAVVAREGGDGSRRAIVLAPRALVLDDLRKLWARSRPGEGLEVAAQAGADPRPALAIVTAADRERYAVLCRAAAELVTGRGDGAARGDHPPPAPTGALHPRWSLPDRLAAGTMVLDYAAVPRQPWRSRAHPLAHLWLAELLEAVQEGEVPLALLEEEVRLGHVRPSLLDQVRSGMVESALLPRSARRRDAVFAPAGEPRPLQRGPLADPVLVLRALGRQLRRRLGAWRRRRLAGADA